MEYPDGLSVYALQEALVEHFNLSFTEEEIEEAIFKKGQNKITMSDTLVFLLPTARKSLELQPLLSEELNDHLHFADRLRLELPHSLHGDLGGLLIGEMEYASGDAAERNTLHAVLPGQFQTGTVAGGQQVLIFRGHTTLNAGANGMQDIVAGQIVSLGDFGLSGGLLMALVLHELGAVQAELDASKGMDAVVNAGVARHIAARHAAVRGVDNGAAPEPGNVALPEVEIAADRLQIGQAGDASGFNLLTQVFVLHDQKFDVDGLGAANVHQRTQHPLLLIGIRWDFHTAIALVLIQQPLDEEYSFFSLVHVVHSITSDDRPIFHCRLSFHEFSDKAELVHVIYFTDIHIAQQMPINAAVILGKSFFFLCVSSLLDAEDFLHICREIAHVENCFIQPHQFGARNISRIGPCITFAFYNNALVFGSTIKSVFFGWRSN